VFGSNNDIPQKSQMRKTSNSGMNWVISELDTNTYPRSAQFNNLPSGIYFYRLETVYTDKKMIFIK
jgi:hypothetical protein